MRKAGFWTSISTLIVRIVVSSEPAERETAAGNVFPGSASNWTSAGVPAWAARTSDSGISTSSRTFEMSTIDTTLPCWMKAPGSTNRSVIEPLNGARISVYAWSVSSFCSVAWDMSRLARAMSRSWSVTAVFSTFRIASRRLNVDSSRAAEARACSISEIISGISSLAMSSPAFTLSPRSLVMSFRKPVTLEYRVTSRSARTEPGRTTFRMRSCRIGLTTRTSRAVLPGSAGGVSPWAPSQPVVAPRSMEPQRAPRSRPLLDWDGAPDSFRVMVVPHVFFLEPASARGNRWNLSYGRRRQTSDPLYGRGGRRWNLTLGGDLAGTEIIGPGRLNAVEARAPVPTVGGGSEGFPVPARTSGEEGLGRDRHLEPQEGPGRIPLLLTSGFGLAVHRTGLGRFGGAHSEGGRRSQDERRDALHRRPAAQHHQDGGEKYRQRLLDSGKSTCPPPHNNDSSHLPDPFARRASSGVQSAPFGPKGRPPILRTPPPLLSRTGAGSFPESTGPPGARPPAGNRAQGWRGRDRSSAAAALRHQERPGARFRHSFSCWAAESAVPSSKSFSAE